MQDYISFVLTTVNAPHKDHFDAEMLTKCLRDKALARAYPGHVGAFFDEIEAKYQLGFARAVGLSNSELVQAAKDFSEYYGVRYTFPNE